MMRWILMAVLIAVASPAVAQTIQPGDGQSVNALGHTWGFVGVQDDYTGNDLLMDGKATSCHGTGLAWDGTTLTLTWHHPYPFDPQTGQPWTPPIFTASITTPPPNIYQIYPNRC